jgi:hypothetical protein
MATELEEAKHSGIRFRRVSSMEGVQKTIDFLIQDVKEHQGSASETIETFGHLWDITVSHSPWGPIVIKREVSILEALFNVFDPEE